MKTKPLKFQVWKRLKPRAQVVAAFKTQAAAFASKRERERLKLGQYMVVAVYATKVVAL